VLWQRWRCRTSAAAKYSFCVLHAYAKSQVSLAVAQVGADKHLRRGAVTRSQQPWRLRRRSSGL